MFEIDHLKEFIRRERQIELDIENQKTYRTYGGKFVLKSKASMGFCMVEFERNNNITIEHKFQVDNVRTIPSLDPPLSGRAADNRIRSCSISFLDQTDRH